MNRIIFLLGLALVLNCAPNNDWPFVSVDNEAAQMESLGFIDFKRLCIDNVTYLSWVSTHGYRHMTVALHKNNEVIVCSSSGRPI